MTPGLHSTYLTLPNGFIVVGKYILISSYQRSLLTQLRYVGTVLMNSELRFRLYIPANVHCPLGTQ
jgi:hypothetical protein